MACTSQDPLSLPEGAAPQDVLAYEDDEFDVHECMLASVRLVEAAARTAELKPGDAIPPWMQACPFGPSYTLTVSEALSVWRCLQAGPPVPPTH
jgi:hypothetical protein